MRCYVCGLSAVEDGITLYRQNAKGIPGVWACAQHNQREIDSEEKALIDALEDKTDDPAD